MKIIRHMRGFLAVMVCAGLVAACAQRQQEDVPQYDTINVVENFVIDENSVPIFPKKAALTTDTAQRFSIELPKRCKVNWDNQTIVSVVPEEPIEMIRLGVGDALPQLQVTDYEFEQLTVKQALDKLLEGTDISVIEDGEVTQTISGSISAGNLADSVELMSKMGRAYYSYDAVNAEIHLDNRAKWMIKMPKNESIIMALLDAMHGADVRNLLVDWQDKTLVFEGNYQTEREVAKIISDIASKKYMIAWDIDIYRVYPRTDNPIIWMNLLPAFGENNIKMSIPGVVGRALVVGPEINTKTLQEFLAQQSNVVLISQGTFVIPNGWQSRFDIGQCSKEDRLETDLVIGATGTYGDYGGKNKIDAKIVLRTSNGELSSFNIPSDVGDNYVIIGIPTHSFVTTPETLISPFAELVVFMSPRIISIVDAAQMPAGSDTALVGDALRAFLSE
ncbi:MAG TPA: hypothetical protein IAD02_01175 [Candidatus Enterousia intestinigallinarum]|uniref:Uncharacterized protein n=1 Tax=Candidatus Enterousia intestinigallinarum TaxID=2840790 RepID=A0A9D1JX62_9PROT|nr:hypothetical protein [Candidatus Enterousia intestinigallinarum]